MGIFKTIDHSPRAVLLLTTAVLLLSFADGNFARGENGGGGSGNAGNQSSPVSKPRALSKPSYNIPPPAAQPASSPAAQARRREEQKPAAEPVEHDPLDR